MMTLSYTMLGLSAGLILFGAYCLFKVLTRPKIVECVSCDRTAAERDAKRFGWVWATQFDSSHQWVCGVCYWDEVDGERMADRQP